MRSAMQLRVLAFVLAGGKGTRLYPLTKERAKPAVPFGGKYRIVDFVLSNLINSGIYSIYVLIQFKSQSLLQHLRDGWQFSGILKNQFIIPVPAQMRTPGETWYRGHGGRHLPEPEPDRAVPSRRGGDLRRRSHLPHEHPRDDRVPRAQRSRSHRGGHSGGEGMGRGVRRDRSRCRRPDRRLPREECRRADHPGQPGHVYASMGNYIFSTPALLRELHDDAENEESGHDFGRDILPSMVGTGSDVRLRLRDQPHSRRSAGSGALLARRGDHRRLLRGEHGPAVGGSRPQPVQPALAAPHRQLPGSAGQVHLRRRGPPRRGHRLDRFGRLHPVRRHGAQFGARPQRAGSRRRRWSRTPSSSTTATSAAAARFAARSWTRT